jgi:uncharacterized protein (DUF736 family)
MAIIGKFEPYNGRYHGRIETISGQIAVRFVPTNATAADAPAFKLAADNGCELDTPCWQTNEGKNYLSVKLDGPFVPQATYAALFANRDGGFDLVCNRPKSPGRDARQTAADR